MRVSFAGLACIVAGLTAVGAPGGDALASSTGQPTISSISPGSGGPGTVITITGSGLSGITAAWIGSAHDAAITNVNSGSVKITVPKDGVSGQIALGNGAHWGFSWQTFAVSPAGSTSTSTGSGGATVATHSTSQPYISSISPSSGPPGTLITISGSGLSSLTQGWVGSGHDAIVTNISSTSVQITVPSDASSGRIALSNGAHWGFSSVAFTVGALNVSSGGTTSRPPTGTPVTGGETGSTSSSGTSSGTSSSSGSSTVSGTSGGSTTVSPNSKLVVRVSGNHLVDGSGNTLQLRGANVSALEFVAIQGWDAADPWGGQAPNWSAMQSWKINAVRIPLNEASWLGYTCVDGAGASHNPDPGANYKATVANAVSAAAAAGIYVILDLHWTAPSNFCPLAQNPMADTDHSIAFWTSIATQFKSYPNVLFELFNEPFVGYSGPVPLSQWQIIMSGGAQTFYITGGQPYQVNYNWQVAGMQQMLNAIRATGATNVVLVGTPSWSQDLSLWLQTKPSDPLGQIAAAWHPYPNSGTLGDPQAALPKLGSIAYTWAAAITAAGYPIVITETGDHDAPGTFGAPLMQNLLPWADSHEISYLGWTWDVWGDADNVLIKDAAGDPTDGYGVYFKQHLVCVGSGGGNCP